VGEEAAVEIERVVAVPRPEASFPADTVPALARLLDDLARGGVRYCHWKSNEHLVAGLAGRTDLDLLVHVDDLAAFREALERRGLKELSAPPAKRFPGMEHWLGFDDGTGALFHLHVHEQLILGEEHVKDHHVPLEGAFLDSVRLLDGVPVPSPELELGVLSVRALLKYRDRDVVKDVLKIRTPGMERVRDELGWLLERTTTSKVGAALRATGEVVPSEVVVRFLDTYLRDPRDGTRFFFLRREVRSAMRGLRRRGRARASALRLARSWSRRLGTVPRMTLAEGSTIALIGSDGSGKSTLARELADWLGWKVDVRVRYLGSKSPSRRSRWSYVAFRALRRGHRTIGRRLGEGSTIARGLEGARDVTLGVHHLAIAHDRARRVETGRREARSGRLVVFDRFPLTTLSGQEDLVILDGPRIRTMLPSGRRSIRALAVREERVYSRFGVPDRLVLLDVSPSVAAARKPDHRREVIEAKVRAARELADLAERHGVRTMRIDADRALDDVSLELRKQVWDVLPSIAERPAGRVAETAEASRPVASP